MIKFRNRFLLYGNILKKKKKEDKSDNKFKDFQVLQILKRNKNRFIAKVRYLKDNKLYAMKRILFPKSDDDNEKEEEKKDNHQKEITILKELNHENIIKYFMDFENNNFIYIITEYVEGSNLNGLVNIYKTINEDIPEEKLINIFLKCLNGLSYLHEKGLIHRDINLNNILIDNQGQIKIISFQNAAFERAENIKNMQISEEEKKNLVCNKTIIGKDYYKAPELSDESINSYDRKIDIYSMGKVFCFLTYFKDSLPSNEGKYSKELYDIINKMLCDIPSQRPSSLQIIEKLKTLYIKKNYFHYSGILSGLSCLEAFNFLKEEITNLSSLLTQKIEKQKINKEDSILYLFNKLLADLSQPSLSLEEKKEKYLLFLYEFREIFYKSVFNKHLRINKEIEPVFVLCFLLDKINIELNKNDSIELGINKGLDNRNKNEIEAYKNYIQWYKKILSPIIIDNIFGTIKTKYIYKYNKCSYFEYSFNLFYIISFNIKTLFYNNPENGNQLGIYDAFNNIKNLF